MTHDAGAGGCQLPPPASVEENEYMSDATSLGDPAAALRLLWRHRVPTTSPRRGPQRGLDVDAVVQAAITIADTQGLAALSMRRLADRLNIRPMSVYTYVPSRAELLDLMLDDAYSKMPRPTQDAASWEPRVRAVAGLNLDLHERHPWTAQLSTLRPPLGPGQLSKYDYELSAFDGSGLDDVTTDDALTYLLGFVRNSALNMQAARQAANEGQADAKWWEQAGPLLSEVVDDNQYPVAARIGTAAGIAHGSAHDPLHAYGFGLEITMQAIRLLARS